MLVRCLGTGSALNWDRIAVLSRVEILEDELVLVFGAGRVGCLKMQPDPDPGPYPYPETRVRVPGAKALRSVSA